MKRKATEDNANPCPFCGNAIARGAFIAWREATGGRAHWSCYEESFQDDDVPVPEPQDDPDDDLPQFDKPPGNKPITRKRKTTAKASGKTEGDEDDSGDLPH